MTYFTGRLYITPLGLTARATIADSVSPENKLMFIAKSATRVRLSNPKLFGDNTLNGSRVNNSECNATARFVKLSVSNTGADAVGVGAGVGVGVGVGVAVGVGVGVGVGAGAAESTLRLKSATMKL